VSDQKLEAAVVGASGYAGQELCKLLLGHPSIELKAVHSARPGAAAGDAPVAGAPMQSVLQADSFKGLDAVFLCTPHGVATPHVRAALDAGAHVVDLSADLRLKNQVAWEAAYGQPHPATDLLDAAVYGLVEHNRESIKGSRLVANPGCYPTSVLLPLLPLFEAQQISSTGPIIADAKSGVSGAGKAPTDTTLYHNVVENFRAYGVGTHRHAPEIAEHADCDRIVFVPHLLPCFRGILTTLYLPPAAGATEDSARAALAQAYAGEPLVKVLESGIPALRDVQNSPRCHMGVASANGSLVVVSVIDNLLKGAASQALQNMNLMLGLDEVEGLL
jgi:N-acetyl-gamma-glutamyl-phosphate reductase